jgi:YidC/Oxa1 family membrane protein insertase
MDRTGIIVVTLCVVLLGVWFVEQQKNAQQQARFAATNQAAKAQSQFAATNSNAVSPTLNNVTTTAVPPVFDTNTPEELLVITNARARYTFTSRGGGLKSVELLDYPETVSPRWRRTAWQR